MENEKFVITDNLLATQFQRFLNWFVDLIFIYILILSLGTTIILIALAIDNFALSDWMKNMSKTEIGFYSLIIAFLYYCLTEMYFSRTIAKLITHTTVVNSDGNKPSKQSFYLAHKNLGLNRLSYIIVRTRIKSGHLRIVFASGG